MLAVLLPLLPLLELRVLSLLSRLLLALPLADPTPRHRHEYEGGHGPDVGVLVATTTRDEQDRSGGQEPTARCPGGS